jgi:two-component system, chemotaxis family, chemotaxis protein CheY
MEREQHDDAVRVFVVDDNDLTRWTLKNIVSRDNRLTLVGDAPDGTSALERINVVQPDLVCLDVMMPRLDGLAVLRSIRDHYAPTAVVIISGHSTPEVLTEATRLGADGFVVKPFNAAKVLDTIHCAFLRHRANNVGPRSR